MNIRFVLKPVLTLLFMFLLSTNILAQKKWNLGFGLQTLRSKIHKNGIDYKLPPIIEESQTISYGAQVIFERKINQNKSIDFGIGFLKIKNDVFIDYSVDNSESRNFYNTINIQRNYISLPINFNYHIHIANNLRLKPSLGLISNFLFNVKDNYISPIEVAYVTYDQYRKLSLLGQIKIGVLYGQEKQNNIGCNLFANYGLNSFATKGTYTWLPYVHFSKSSEIQSGLEFIFFF